MTSSADNSFVKGQVKEAKEELKTVGNVACAGHKPLQHLAALSADIGILVLDGQCELKDLLKQSVANDSKKLFTIKNGKKSLNWQGFGATEICLIILALGMAANMYFNYRVRLTLAEKNMEKETATKQVASALRTSEGK